MLDEREGKKKKNDKGEVMCCFKMINKVLPSCRGDGCEDV